MSDVIILAREARDDLRQRRRPKPDGVPTPGGVARRIGPQRDSVRSVPWNHRGVPGRRALDAHPGGEPSGVLRSVPRITSRQRPARRAPATGATR